MYRIRGLHLLDTTSDVSAAVAFEQISDKCGYERLHGIVNNAGIGLVTGQSGDILNTNLYGPKRIYEQFLDKWRDGLSILLVQ